MLQHAENATIKVLATSFVTFSEEFIKTFSKEQKLNSEFMDKLPNGSDNMAVKKKEFDGQTFY